MSSPEAAEQRWRLTLDNAPVGTAIVTLDGTWTYVNESLCAMLGYSAEELLQVTWHRITHPDDLDDDLSSLGELLAGDVSGYRMRKRFLHLDGHVVWADLSVALVRDEQGEPLHLVSHISDLTDEMAAAERIAQMNAELSEKTDRLEASNADLEAFAMLVSHDLQTPLATVVGYMQLLEGERADVLDPQALDWVARAGAAALRMSELVSSVLAMSRSERELERVPVQVEDLVLQVCADLAPLIEETGAAVEVSATASLVVAEPARLRQVLQNLVQNALKYHHPDRVPHVLVTVADGDEPRTCLITVDDNGAGIDPDRRQSVFALFSRADGGDLQRPGHGIGLASCRRVVERHGGRIWIEDNPAGPGTRFAFTLRH